MTAAIEVQDLYKAYPSGAKAVSGLSFEVRKGEIFGLLGPNGSGKTTTVRILSTLLRKTSGIAMVDGIDVDRRPRDVRKVIGYAGQFIGVDDDLTARENLILHGRLHGITAKEAASRTEELLDAMGLTEMADVRVNRFSGGMRRRVDLVQSLVHRPPILFLDEPTTGMDPQSRNALWKYLAELKQAGVSILLTTQYLEEADRACARVAIIDEGQLITIGDPRTLKEELGADRVTLVLDSPLPEDFYSRAAGIAASVAGVASVEEVEPLVLSVLDAATTLPRVQRAVEAAGIEVVSIRQATVTLDDVFLKLTGHKARSDTNIEHGLSAMVAMVHGGRRQ